MMYKVKFIWGHEKRDLKGIEAEKEGTERRDRDRDRKRQRDRERGRGLPGVCGGWGRRQGEKERRAKSPFIAASVLGWC